jgi:hypothetical protein
MKDVLSLFGGALLLALVGCAHEGARANSPASDTMESQMNDMGSPFLSTPKPHEGPPNTPVDRTRGVDDLNPDSDSSSLAPKPPGRPSETPEPHENTPPNKPTGPLPP